MIKKVTAKKTLKVLLTGSLIASLGLISLTGCRSQPEVEEELFEEAPEQATPEYLTYGDTFTVNDMELTLGDGVTAVTVVDNTSNSNLAANHEGITYLKLPVKVTNVSSGKQSFSLSGCTFFDNTGIEYTYPASSLGDTSVMSDGSISKDDITRIGVMRQGATIDSFFYLIYNANGKYYIDFTGGGMLSGGGIEIELDINLIDPADKEGEAGEGAGTTEEPDGTESKTPEAE